MPEYTLQPPNSVWVQFEFHNWGLVTDETLIRRAQVETTRKMFAISSFKWSCPKVQCSEIINYEIEL